MRYNYFQIFLWEQLQRLNYHSLECSQSFAAPSRRCPRSGACPLLVQFLSPGPFLCPPLGGPLLQRLHSSPPFWSSQNWRFPRIAMYIRMQLRWPRQLSKVSSPMIEKAAAKPHPAHERFCRLVPVSQNGSATHCYLKNLQYLLIS